MEVVKPSPFKVRKTLVLGANSKPITPKPTPAVPTGELVPNSTASLSDFEDRAVPTASLQIYQYVQSFLERIEEEGLPKDQNRASAAPACPTKRWYRMQGFKEETMSPRTIINFAMGDIAEVVMAHFVAHGLVGPGKLYSEVDFGTPANTFRIQKKEFTQYHQPDLLALVGDIPVTAHADGWGKRNSDGQWEYIEFKSSSNYGFSKFKEGEDGYIKQAHVLMKTNKAIALGVTQTRFFFLRKETGHIWDRVVKFDENIWNEVVQEYAAAAGPTMPPAPFELSRDKLGRLVAKYPCSRCGFLEQCKGKYKIEMGKAFGKDYPIFVITAPNESEE